MARLCTCFHDEFSDEAGASDDQNLAFLSHLEIPLAKKENYPTNGVGDKER
jgi:hypothetical protein